MKSSDYFQMRHISDKISSSIIQAHMQGVTLEFPVIDPIYRISLLDQQGSVVHGEETGKIDVSKNDYYQWKDETILVSDAPQEHLSIAFVVVRSDQLHRLLKSLKTDILAMMALIASATVMIAWILSKLFMRPLRQRIEQIETFIKDVTHELNTPITALSMATGRAMKREVYDRKALRNISISTKQLYDIYASLTYLNFSHKSERANEVDLEQVLLKSIDYYKELCESKDIEIHIESQTHLFAISEDRAAMLFGNLISNAIKYSMARSEISITLKDRGFAIEDHGIGIDKARLSKIFERYNRETEYAGGFGVGLSIVQSICDEYDIEVNVTSEPDKGSIFTLTF